MAKVMLTVEMSEELLASLQAHAAAYQEPLNQRVVMALLEYIAKHDHTDDNLPHHIPLCGNKAIEDAIMDKYTSSKGYARAKKASDFPLELYLYKLWMR